jgi:uncharacterized protein (DUF697 family)/predicted GTPase
MPGLGAPLGDTWKLVRQLVRANGRPPDLEKELAGLRTRVPAPVFWLFGKTQSGKTSLVRFLTGAEDAAIGSGFRPCTRTSREYPFPTADVPVLTFLDTRGVDEPGYDPAEDIAAFDPRAHLLVVTSRVTDFAHGGVRDALRTIRDSNRSRPCVLVLTCLHEALLPDPHPTPYPFDAPGGAVPDKLARLIAKQTEEFAGLVDRVVPVDLTKPEEGFPDPDYGGAALKRAMLDLLPTAYRETLARMTDVTKTLRDAHLRHAAPVIVAYSSMAATAGAVPVPFLDLLMLPAIQAKMVHELAALYGQPQTAARFLELAASLGIGLAARTAVRELVKFIPFVGSAAGAALAWASTYALGRAFCEYFQEVHRGHIPPADSLKRLYHAQFAAAERAWSHPK